MATDFLYNGRKVKLQERVSSTPAKPVATKKRSNKAAKSGTVAVANVNFTSTNISSPIQPKARRQKAMSSYVDEAANGVSRGGSFVAGDDDDDDYSDSDGFERIREVGTSTRVRRQQLGPPIASDRLLDATTNNPAHREVIGDFVKEAKILDEKLRHGKSRRRHIFTESQLREMAINWPHKLDEILQIRGVDREDVQTFGPKFLPLISKFFKRYENMMETKEQRDIDNAHRNTVNLLSDEEDGGDGDSQDLETTSKFFNDPEVQRFNRRVDEAQDSFPVGPPRTLPWDKKEKKGDSSRKSAGRRKKHSNESSAAGGSNNRVTKRRSAGKRPSNGGSTSGASATMRQSTIGGHGGGWGRTGGIGMMPI